MLNLQSQECQISHVNFRTEKHGDDDVTAVDLKLSANMPPSVLEQLVPGLADALFQPANSSGAMKGEKALRFPDLVNVFRLQAEIPGYALAIEWGMSGKLIQFGDVELGKIAVELIDGGAVTLTFRVQIAGDPAELAQLVPMLNLSLPVTLTPPAAEPLPKEHPDHPDHAKPKSPKAVTKDAKGEDDDPFAGSDLARKPPESVTGKAARKSGAAAAAH